MHGVLYIAPLMLTLATIEILRIILEWAIISQIDSHQHIFAKLTIRVALNLGRLKIITNTFLCQYV